MSRVSKSFFIVCVGLVAPCVLWEFCLATGKKKFFLPPKKTSSPKKPHKQPESSNSEKDIYQWFKTYSEVISLVEKKAFRTVNFSKFIQGSLKAAAAEIDAHSAFLSNDSYQSAMESTQGEFPGIGVSIISKAPDDDALVIVDVIPGGPAQIAGLLSGDKIVEADGHKFKGLSTDEAISKLKGKPGSVLTIKFLRNKKPLEMKITRDIIKDQTSLSYVFKSYKIYYLALKMFTENVAQQVAELLKIANAGKCKGIIIDLRRNPGGTLQSAIEMSGLFVENNSLIAVTKDRDHKIVDQYFTTTDPILKTDVPIFILIDNFTASAAEILAGALRYHSMQSYEKKDQKKRSNILVFLVGTETFGKGSVQEVIPISNGCALKLTTMMYYLPGDLSIQATGIAPDFIIKPRFIPTDEMKWVAEMYGKEKSLKHHISVKEATGKAGADDEKKDREQAEQNSLEDLMDAAYDAPKATSAADDEKKDENYPQKWEERQKEELGHDIQVQAAVNMINLLGMARLCDAKILSTRQRALEFLKSHYLTDDKVEIEKVK